MKKLTVIAAACAAALAPKLDRAAIYLRAAARWARINTGIALHNYLGSQGLIMGASAFTKQETVFFDQMLAGFDDLLTLGRNVSHYNADATVLERSQGGQIWRPVPYVSVSIDGASGTDISGSFGNITQLSAPIGLGYDKTVPWIMSSNDLNDPKRVEQKQQSAVKRLATDINMAVANVAALQGTLVVKRNVAASGFDDLAAADSMMVEQGLTGEGRRVAILHARDYNSMASALAKPATSANPKVNTAYEKAYVGQVSGFETFKSDYTYRLGAAAGTTVTVNGANQFYVPKATSKATSGEEQNVDNRYQSLTVAVTSGTIKVGDRFTIAGVNAVHHISKQDTGQLKTFTVTGIVTGAGGSGVIQISPPLVAGAAGGGSQVEKEYQNVTAVPANGAAITWLNTAGCNATPFWDDRAIELLPGRNGVDAGLVNSGAGFMRSTTELGIEVIMYKFFDINTKTYKYRTDTRFGVGMTNPEMCGVILFNQT